MPSILSTFSSSAVIIFLQDLDTNSSGLIIYPQTTHILTDGRKFIIFVNPEECYGIQLHSMFIELRIMKSKLLLSQLRDREENQTPCLQNPTLMFICNITEAKKTSLTSYISLCVRFNISGEVGKKRHFSKIYICILQIKARFILTYIYQQQHRLSGQTLDLLIKLKPWNMKQ